MTNLNKETTNKSKLRKLNSSRVNSINKYVNKLHSDIDELYEALIDNEIEEAIVIQRRLSYELRSLKIDNP